MSSTDISGAELSGVAVPGTHRDENSPSAAATRGNASSAPPDPAVPPATGFRRVALGASVVVGGLLTVGGFATTVWETGPGKLAYLDSLVVNPLQSQIAAVLLFFGYLAIFPMMLALAAMTRRRWRLGGNIAVGLSAIGALALPGLLVTDFYDLAIRQGLPADVAVRVSDAAQDLPLAVLIGGPFIMLTFVGMIVGAVSAWRAGFFHWGFAVLIVASFAVMFLPEDIAFTPGVNIGMGALLGAFMASVGIAALRMTNREWATGERR
ncbi:MAG: hypothetical protein OJJ54_21980 [Pseudonocardia sp.]|nr:hypothetical protein [Pseudonocardia sp.]